MGRLGLIGSGNIGSTVARLAVAAGIDVVLSNSRGPETLAGLVAELGPRASAATAAEAAAAGDWVLVSVPLKNYRQIPVAPLAGKTVLDTNNYYPGRDGAFPELDSGATTSAELLQAHLAGAHVVKVFNNIFFKHLLGLARPSGAPDRSALPIAGDAAAAKRQATELLDALGYDTVDAGPLAEGWRFQPDTPAYGVPYLKDPSQPFPEDPGQPGAAQVVRDALAAAERAKG
ncbi:NADPH-dependent F420 reductase [Streptantibioticus silvisoli]|uniref:NAD(P)-binding domain-containing protein n=1 Tax=Streptantibioticus silvisoli TaxID=2705255 RepID=A0ABT6VUB1_9ACTN|nr:NAD(P)-binding domain-containing protein [Streptantibioticus silvisoli]MDI5961654.1 NAD(P)-binding domain-containing protein [Streptantibioticus silvisoli]